MTKKNSIRLMMIGVIVSTIGLAFSVQASAQVLCAPLPDMLSRLFSRFGEVPIWEGVGSTHKTIVTANGEGRWSIIQVALSGEPACLVATGNTNKTDRGI